MTGAERLLRGVHQMKTAPHSCQAEHRLEMSLRIKQNAEPDDAIRVSLWYGEHYFNTYKIRW